MAAASSTRAYFGSATVMLTNSTFSGNSAGLAGNSIGNDANPGNATLVIGNTIFECRRFGRTHLQQRRYRYLAWLQPQQR